jgi:DNA polymerase elongation subunit (family B)
VFYNFVESYFYEFKEQDGTSLKQAYEMYKQYCDESLVDFKLPMYKFREELKNYFKNFEDITRIDGKQVRSYYSGFLVKKFMKTTKTKQEPVKTYSIEFKEQESIFDKEFSEMPAQYASAKETPTKKWVNVNTTLASIDTSKLHYVKVPENHIVIDFDLKDEEGNKSFEKNLKEASKWPKTYSELSKSEAGIHLHYFYDGDPEQLSRLYSEHIEIKVFSGDSSLRRKLTLCNDIPIAHINSGLPLKERTKNVINFESVNNEKAMRTIIKKSLNKEYPPHATKPSIDFIFKVLEDAYNSGVSYDVRDLRPAIMAFANNSSNQSEYCIKQVSKMKFTSDETAEGFMKYKSDKLVFYDVEVFSNLFVIVYKMEGKNPVKLINPTSVEVEDLLKYKLVGFNCRRYDNHILYARLMGYNNEQLYMLSQRIINGSRNCMFGEAYGISYADVLDFVSKKQSLKKYELELDIHHQELGIPWDQPAPESLWELIADYCVNDVIATEAVFNARKQDFIAREVLADISGLTVNDTTQQHTARIIFGKDPHPQDKFVYTDLSEMYPGYTFDNGVSSYRGENPGEGGYVYSEPGMYTNVALLDVASMHPNSLIQLNAFGPYTKNFKELLDARLAIKHRDFNKAKKMLGGALEPYLESEDQADALAYALKIVINSVYGLTSAKFDCKFKDPRNIDNIVAKRGALFMIDLKYAVQEKGFTVAHIKTDSIKIPDATPEIIQYVMDMGMAYGYTFEHEATYDRMCLVNDAVYIARYATVEKCYDLYGQKYVESTKDICKENKKHPYDWTATGAQFAQPYVFKTLFSHEDLIFKDMCETKTVNTALYLDMNESLPEEEHDYRFVGKAGLFTPIMPGCGGGILLRHNKEGDGYSAAVGTKGYRWMESEMVKELHKENEIDKSYYTRLVDEAVKDISKFGDFEWFIAD